MYKCMHVYIYTYVYIHICIYAYNTYIYTDAHTCIYMQKCLYTCIMYLMCICIHAQRMCTYADVLYMLIVCVLCMPSVYLYVKCMCICAYVWCVYAYMLNVRAHVHTSNAQTCYTHVLFMWYKYNTSIYVCEMYVNMCIRLMAFWSSSGSTPKIA